MTMTAEQFIAKANIIHNNKYSYEKTQYIGIKNKIIIICPLHGEFIQLADDHKNGSGCKKCAINTRSSAKTLTTKSFIDRSKIIHNNLSGNKQKLTLEVFLEKANIVHNNYYDYSNINLIDTKNNIIISCPIHSKFTQSAGAHLSGSGCQKCVGRISKIEIKWLNTLCIREEFRQYTIKINNKNIKVDGFNPTTNTIYEFYGDFWHGNPHIYNANDINPCNKISFGKLYQNTIEREKLIKSSKFNLITVWENDFKNK